MKLPTTADSKLSMIYLHVPKCGGSYVQETFAPYSQHCPTIRWPDAQGHLTYLEYREVFANHGQDVHDRLILTVVRNPWAWHVSWFNYVRRDRWGKRSGLKVEHKLFRRMNFSDYLEWLDDDDAPQSPQGYLKKLQSDWLCDERGRLRADYVLHQETLLAELNDLIDVLNIDVQPINRRVNVSTKDDYRLYYDTRGIELIARRHRRDCELFGYEFSAESAPQRRVAS